MPLIFLDKVKVVPSNNDGPHHLGTVASASKDSSSDRNIASERALLVYICSCKQVTPSVAKIILQMGI